MFALALLGAVLAATIAMAARMAAAPVDAIALDPAELLRSKRNLSAVVRNHSDFAFEPLREALTAASPRDRQRWLAEADAGWHLSLRPVDAELRACARAANAASFCAAAWALRAGIANRGEAPLMAVDGPIGQGVACIALGFLTTGAIASIHRRLAEHLRDERAAFASLLGVFDDQENASPVTESRA